MDLDAHLPAIASGDTHAFGLWMAAAEPVLRDRLLRYAAAVDTEAVLQETLLRLWQIAPRFTPDGRENGLLRLGFVVARNLAVSEIRRRRRDLPVEPGQVAQTEGAEPSPPDPMLREVIQRCRAALPDKPAQALSERLSSAGAEPDATLAQRIGMRTNTFLQNITRARKLLADCLRKHGVHLEAELAR